MRTGRFSRLAITAAAGSAAILASLLLAVPAQAASAAHAKPTPAAAAGAARYRQVAAQGPKAEVHRLTSAQVRSEGLGKYVARSGGCWQATFYHINIAIIWLGSSEVWCSNGSTITYNQAGNCFGGVRYPTYNYFGCSRTDFFGTGYTFGFQEATWQACIVWVPWPVSTCLDQESPTNYLDYYPNGSISVS
jgi:hypothetical protein